MTGTAASTVATWEPAAASDPATGRPTPFPHVVAWNLTRRCNLACAHCYIAAGSWHAADEELPTGDCLRVVDEIVAVNPGVLLILSGGEPLLRDDLETIAARAAEGGATVVVGTNGTRLDGPRIASLQAAGVRGVAVSLDSLDPLYHDRFRHGEGALADTLAGVARVRAAGLDFIVQTTVTRGNRAEIAGLAAWAAEAGAVAFNLYFLVATGRGEGMRGLSPAENEEVLAELAALERRYRGRMMVRSKCMPAIMRRAHAEAGAVGEENGSPLLDYATRCPCGVQYCRITPEGKVTPCPYLPEVAGDLTHNSFEDVWRESPLFRRLREGALTGRCGACEYRAVCGGCRARGYAEHGDVLAEDPACGYEPPGDRALVLPRGAVRYGDDAPAEGLPWDDDARARLDRVPSFVRAVVAARVERFAVGRGHTRVTAAALEEVRAAMPIDFSKARPFFLGERR